MDFRQLHYIVTVAELKSITKAAKQLYITQPALSSLIAKTEQELGEKLFDRSTSPLSLTYAGEKYLAFARQVLMLNDEMSKEFRDITDNMKGRLTIGFPRERAAFIMPMVLPEFKKRYPNIEVKITEANGDDLMEYLTKGRIDFAIMPFYLTTPSVKRHVLMENEGNIETVDIYREHILLAGKEEGEHSALQEIEDLKDLEKYPFILLRKGHVLRRTTDFIFKKVKIKPEIVMETSSSISAYRLASSGIGIAIVPKISFAMAKPCCNVNVRHLDEDIYWDICGVFRKDSYIGKAETAFCEITREVLNEYFQGFKF